MARKREVFEQNKSGVPLFWTILYNRPIRIIRLGNNSRILTNFIMDMNLRNNNNYRPMALFFFYANYHINFDTFYHFFLK